MYRQSGDFSVPASGYDVPSGYGGSLFSGQTVASPASSVAGQNPPGDPHLTASTSAVYATPDTVPAFPRENAVPEHPFASRNSPFPVAAAANADVTDQTPLPIQSVSGDSVSSSPGFQSEGRTAAAGHFSPADRFGSSDASHAPADADASVFGQEPAVAASAEKSPPFGGFLSRLPFFSSFSGFSGKGKRLDPTLLLLIWLVLEGGHGEGVLPYLLALLLLPE